MCQAFTNNFEMILLKYQNVADVAPLGLTQRAAEQWLFLLADASGRAHGAILSMLFTVQAYH